MNNTIQWPALLILENDDILYYLNSDDDLCNELNNHYLSHKNTCTLVQQTGIQFSLHISNDRTSPLPFTIKSTHPLSLETFNQMVRNHLSARQQCCVLKIAIDSFEQGFQLIRNTQED